MLSVVMSADKDMQGESVVVVVVVVVVLNGFRVSL